MKVVYFLLAAIFGFAVGDFLAASQAHAFSPIARFTDNGCIVYCNGSPVTSYNNSCDGAQNAECQGDGLTVSATCLGTYDLVITPQLRITINCDGLFFSTVSGTTPKGEPFTEESSCGGSTNLDYSIESISSFKPTTPVNRTCDGTFMLGAEVTPTPTATPNPTHTPTHGPTPTPSKGGGVGVIGDAPPGYTCTYMCGSQEYDGVVCNGDFELNCDVEEEGKSSTLKYGCQGVFVGGWQDRACIGYSKAINSGEDYVYTEICTKQSGFKKLGEKAEEMACQGEFSAKTAIFSVPKKTKKVA